MNAFPINMTVKSGKSMQTYCHLFNGVIPSMVTLGLPTRYFGTKVKQVANDQ